MSMKVSTILDQIDLGQIAMPKFQRPYVWNRDQVRNLIKSMYLGHPVGGLLFWNTLTSGVLDKVKGEAKLSAGAVKLLLDGQQRITSLYGIIRGKEPPFFEGESSVFTNLWFNVDSQEFEFYAQQKMANNPLWLSVTELMQSDIGKYFGRIGSMPEAATKGTFYFTNISRLQGIINKELNYEEVDSSKEVEEVVEIFNKVNSGGTKLSKGDLALAKICASWPEARDELRKRLEKWKQAGFDFEMDWFLRCINAIVTGEALFSQLDKVSTEQFKSGLVEAEKAVNYLLNLMSSRLGIDHNSVLGSRYSFPVMVRYLHDRGGTLNNYQETNKLLYWYVNTFLWGRYAGSTESVINQDLAAIADKENALDELIALLRQNRGDLTLQPVDFIGWSLGSRFYPLLYIMSRVGKTRDLGSGLELSKHMFGSSSSLQVHHIFPKALLYKHGYNKAQVNALANLTFLTQQTNLAISDKAPEIYLPSYSAQQPGAIESHWIPNDPTLWKVENYEQFLSERRNLLATAANKFLEELLKETASKSEVGQVIVTPSGLVTPTRVIEENDTDNPEEDRLLSECNEWVKSLALPLGTRLYQLNDDAGNQLAVLDLAWPQGLQTGYSDPVALLIDEPQEVKDRAQQQGFRYFTSVEKFKEYVKNDILAVI